jgi:hypothetical protein
MNDDIVVSFLQLQYAYGHKKWSHGMEQKGYWEKEEFEDLVVRGLITLYETRLRKHKEAHKVFRFTPELLNNIRRIGCYFVPVDRVIIGEICENGKTLAATQKIDIANDGRPDYAIHCHGIDSAEHQDNDDMRKNSFLEINYLEKISKLPHPIKCKHEGRKYRIVSVWARNDCLEGHVHHIVISSDGSIHDTYWTRPNYDPVTGRCPMETVDAKFCQSKEESERAESINTVIASSTVQLYQDRRYLWNVTAKENIAKATFGVYPEQIKSLFYAREMPMTETGRKRPILHWVKAHQRRIKEGIDIDIEKHLRGINEFVYQGTKFIITRPIKNITSIT